MKIERLYSNYDEYYDEKLYSTGNDELDELLERAFCDGYEYAQREFGKVGDWLKGKTEGDRNRKIKIANNYVDKYIEKHPNIDPKDDKMITELSKKALIRAKGINMAGKAAMIALPTAAVVGTGVAIKKHKDKKKKEEE